MSNHDDPFQEARAKCPIHVAFGFGAYLCLGAHHARAVMRGLIQKLSERVSHIETLETFEMIEN